MRSSWQRGLTDGIGRECGMDRLWRRLDLTTQPHQGLVFGGHLASICRIRHSDKSVSNYGLNLPAFLAFGVLPPGAVAC